MKKKRTNTLISLGDPTNINIFLPQLLAISHLGGYKSLLYIPIVSTCNNDTICVLLQKYLPFTADTSLIHKMFQGCFRAADVSGCNSSCPPP